MKASAQSKASRNNNAVVAQQVAQQHDVAEQHTVVAEQHTVPMQQELTTPVVEEVVAPAKFSAEHYVRRANRVAAIGNTLRARRNAELKQQSQGATLHAKQAAYMAAVQALAAQHGLPVPNTMSVRAVAGEQKNAPSNNAGACKRVREFVHANPTMTRKEVKEHFSGSNYINPATVSTQFQLAKQGKA